MRGACWGWDLERDFRSAVLSGQVVPVEPSGIVSIPGCSCQVRQFGKQRGRLLESFAGQGKKVIRLCPGGLINPCIFQDLLLFTNGRQPGFKIWQEASVEGFVLPPEAGGIEGHPGSGTKVRQGLPADANGFENGCAGSGCAGCPERLGIGREPGDQGTGCLAGVAEQSIGGMRVQTASLPMTTPALLAPISAPHIQKGRLRRTGRVAVTWGMSI